MRILPRLVSALALACLAGPPIAHADWIQFNSTWGYANGALGGQPASSVEWATVGNASGFTVNTASGGGVSLDPGQTATSYAVYQYPVNFTATPTVTQYVDFQFTQSSGSGTGTVFALSDFFGASSGNTGVSASFVRNTGTDGYRITFYQSSGTPATSVGAAVTGASIGLNSAVGDNASDLLSFVYTLTRGASASAWTGSVVLLNLTKSTVVASFEIPTFATSTSFYGATALYPDVSSATIQNANVASCQIRYFGTTERAIGGNFSAPMTSYNSSLFYLSDLDPGAAAIYYLKPSHDVFGSGGLSLTLDNTATGSKSYTSGAVQSRVYYGYGRAQASIKMANTANGVDNGFYLYTGNNGNHRADPWDEIDFEYVPYNTHVNQIHIGYFTNGVAYAGQYIDLGFDPRAAFHTYAIDWEPTGITWYVDGVAVHQESGAAGPLPSHPMKIITDLWPGNANTLYFTGAFTYPGVPLVTGIKDESYTLGFVP